MSAAHAIEQPAKAVEGQKQQPERKIPLIPQNPRQPTCVGSMATKPPQGHIGKAARGQSASQPLKTEPVPPSKWARLKDFRRDEKVVFHIVEPCRIDRRAARGMMAAIEERLIGMQIVSNLAKARSEVVVAGVEKIRVVPANGAVSGSLDKETERRTAGPQRSWRFRRTCPKPPWDLLPSVRTCVPSSVGQSSRRHKGS